MHPLRHAARLTALLLLAVGLLLAASLGSAEGDADAPCLDRCIAAARICLDDCALLGDPEAITACQESCVVLLEDCSHACVAATAQ